ncbi:unnamed protein product (macronuclear) [Paramecium tetraurelia]|uniref:Uncharacterized protein n=1 Tax=Paramecium tetraurelia TaxID=5888 RepID=A0BXQ6_PARTE|nr:uncharacterized protein GSPATT00033176001 [Paramecium tetraurelia]CAK63323.1 unnamed protein product [Paramecium tetraurelia]|eukprot:XP_001430721.1 hypothetical protein (macronuclear) [Paramecium tetraurelia strain d4-2]
MGCKVTKNNRQLKDVDHFMNILEKNTTEDETKISEKNKLFQIKKNPIFQRRLSQKKENTLTKQTYSYLERNNQTQSG